MTTAFDGLTMSAVDTLDEACRRYNMDFTPVLRPLTYEDANGNLLVSPYHRQVVREETDNPLGVVGLRYFAQRYRESLSLVEPLIAGGARILGGGAPHYGERAFLVLEADGVVRLGSDPDDAIRNRFFVTSSHDGTSKVEVRLTPYLPRAGTALTFEKRPLAFKHTKRLPERVTQARRTYARVNDSWNEFTQNVQRLVSIPVTERQAQDFIEMVLGKGDSTRAQNTREEIYLTFTQTGICTTLPKCRGTLFGLVQAFAEWADLKRAPRKSTRRDEVSATLNAKLLADGARKKQKAYATALTLANSKKLRGASVGNI